MVCFAPTWLRSGSRALTGHREFVAEANNRLNSAWDITDLPPYRRDVTSTNCWPTCTTSQASYGGSFSPFHLREVIDVLREHFLRLFRTPGAPYVASLVSLSNNGLPVLWDRSDQTLTTTWNNFHPVSSCHHPWRGESRSTFDDSRRDLPNVERLGYYSTNNELNNSFICSLFEDGEIISVFSEITFHVVFLFK